MLAALWAVTAPTLAIVLAVSAIAKLRSPASVDRSFRDLAVPPVFSQVWMRRAFPWGELALAVLLLVTPSIAAIVVTTLTLALFVAYLVLVARSLAQPEPVSCGCFGESNDRPVDRWTLVRNIVLVAVAATGLAALIADPEARAGAWFTLIGPAAPVIAGAAVAALVVLALGRNGDLAATPQAPIQQVATIDPSPSAASFQANGRDSIDDEVLDEYERQQIPASAVQLPDGTITGVRALARQQAIFLIFAAPGCGPCVRVIGELDRVRRAVAPIEVLVVNPVGVDPAGAAAAGYALDIGDGISAAFNVPGRPWAAVLGVDGMLAGGPVLGADEIFELADDIRAEFDAAGLTADLTIDDYTERVEQGLADPRRSTRDLDPSPSGEVAGDESAHDEAAHDQSSQRVS